MVQFFFYISFLKTNFKKILPIISQDELFNAFNFKIIQRDFHYYRNSRHISIASSPSQHNTVTKGHEFKPSTDKKLTQETVLNKSCVHVCMYFCVCEYACTRMLLPYCPSLQLFFFIYCFYHKWKTALQNKLIVNLIEINLCYYYYSNH